MSDDEDSRVERLAEGLGELFSLFELNGILWHVIRHADDNTGARMLYQAAHQARAKLREHPASAWCDRCVIDRPMRDPYGPANRRLRHQVMGPLLMIPRYPPT